MDGDRAATVLTDHTGEAAVCICQELLGGNACENLHPKLLLPNLAHFLQDKFILRAAESTELVKHI